MDNVLERICADKRQHIVACKAIRSFDEIESAARKTLVPRGFAMLYGAHQRTATG